MRKADIFSCRRYIVKYDDKEIAEEALSIKRCNTEDFPEFFDGRIFKPDKAAALTGKDCRKIAKRCNASPGTGEKARLDSHHISSKEYNDYIAAYCEENFLKRAEKNAERSKNSRFSGCRTTQPVSAAGNGKRQKTAEGINIGRQPVAGTRNGKERRRSSGETACSKRKKRRPQKVLAQFESAVLTRRKSLPFSGRLFEQTRLCRQDVSRHNILFENIVILR